MTGYPVIQLMTLVETGTRALIGAAFGTTADGELTWARRLLHLLDESMLVLMDRGFDGGEFLHRGCPAADRLRMQVVQQAWPAGAVPVLGVLGHQPGVFQHHQMLAYRILVELYVGGELSHAHRRWRIRDIAGQAMARRVPRARASRCTSAAITATPSTVVLACARTTTQWHARLHARRPAGWALGR